MDGYRVDGHRPGLLLVPARAGTRVPVCEFRGRIVAAASSLHWALQLVSDSRSRSADGLDRLSDRGTSSARGHSPESLDRCGGPRGTGHDRRAVFHR